MTAVTSARSSTSRGFKGFAGPRRSDLLRHPQACGPDRVDVRERPYARADLIRHRIVEREDHERLAPRMEPADLHGRDVHVVLAQERTDASDEAGLVLVLREEQMSFDRHVDPEVVDEHDARIALDEGPRDLCGAHAHREQRRVTRRLSLAPLLNHQAARSGEVERIHEVHALLAEGFEEPLDRGRAEWLGVELEDGTSVRERELRWPIVEK